MRGTLATRRDCRTSFGEAVFLYLTRRSGRWGFRRSPEQSRKLSILTGGLLTIMNHCRPNQRKKKTGDSISGNAITCTRICANETLERSALLMVLFQHINQTLARLFLKKINFFFSCCHFTVLSTRGCEIRIISDGFSVLWRPASQKNAAHGLSMTGAVRTRGRTANNPTPGKFGSGIARISSSPR